MPTILLDRKRINKALNKELSLEELEKLLEYIKCEIKEQNEDELLCEITTDRADCFSTEGIIRALKGVLGIEKGLVNLNFFEDDIELHVDESVKNIRPYVAMATVRGLKLDPRALESIIRFQEVLHETLGRNRRKASIGLYDLSKLDKKIFFKNMDLEKIKFIPLEKNEILDGYRILSETEKGKQYRHLVGQSSAPVLVDNNGTFLSMAPIINSQDAKVTTKTTDILIDSTGFDLNFITSIVGLMAYALSFYGGKVGL
ncbi:MAG TPA: phenylalanine--tRNA ligase beta subunit-related protein, partial [Geobacterales bacterium]|nr:phenylalanine--tRNA ligase beta subunit-related protein [Geobacterales bacterium]